MNILRALCKTIDGLIGLITLGFYDPNLYSRFLEYTILRTISRIPSDNKEDGK